MASYKSDKPSNLFVDDLLCQCLKVWDFSFDISHELLLAISSVLSWLLKMRSTDIWWRFLFLSFFVVGGMKHPSFKTRILFQYVLYAVILQSDKLLESFTKSSDEKRCKLNTSETSLDQNISTSQGRWWFWQVRAVLLIALRLCRCSVDWRGYVTDNKTNCYRRSFLIGWFAVQWLPN